MTSLSDAGASRVRVFTTRIDTIYGANAIVLAAEHPVIQANIENFSEEVARKIAYIRVENAKPTDHEVEIEKDGIDTGLKAINPFSGEELPVWVGNYVMMEYGTGAVMSVPAHDERDFEFAKKFGLPIRQVISEPQSCDSRAPSRCRHLADSSRLLPTMAFWSNSDDWYGKTSEDAKKEMAEYAAETWFWRGGDDISPARLGHFATAFLGLADTDRLLRQMRRCAGKI